MLALKVVYFISLACFVNSELHFSIYKLECIKEDETFYVKNISCFLKTVSRGLNVLTSISDFVQPLNFIKVNFTVYEKSSANTYRTVIIDNSVDICSLWMKGSGLPPIIQLIMPLVSKFAPNFFHPCPYQGKRIGVENLPIDMSFLPLIQLSNIQKGQYRADIFFYDSNDVIIHWIKLYGAIQQKSFTKKHLGNAMKVSTILPTAATKAEKIK